MQLIETYDIDLPPVEVDGKTFPGSCLVEDQDGFRILMLPCVVLNRTEGLALQVPARTWVSAGSTGARMIASLALDGGWWTISSEHFMDEREEHPFTRSFLIPVKSLVEWDHLPTFREMLTKRLIAEAEPEASPAITGFVHLHTHSEFCLAPETLVATTDMQWKPIGDVEVGESLVGFDEDLRPEEGRRGNSRSKMRPTEVLATKRRIRDCYRITLENGTQVIASARHGWVSNGTTKGSLIEPEGPPGGSGANTRRWVTTEELVPGKSRLISWARPWAPLRDDQQRDAAYLAGIMDGEGWIHEGQVGLAQNPGLVLSEILRACGSLGYPVTDLRKQSNKGECLTFRLRGYEVALRALSQCRPVRLLPRLEEVWVGRRAGGRYSTPMLVVGLEHLGEMETVALTTSTKTFVAEGFLSHNSPLDGMSTMPKIVREVVRHGQQAVSVNDHGTCAGHPNLQIEASKAGIKPVFGIEANLVDDRFRRGDPAIVGDGKKVLADYSHLILWAESDRGLQNIWAASTEANRDGFYARPRMDWKTLERCSEGVLASTGCLRGPVSRKILEGDEDGARAVLAKLMGIYPDRLYAEIHTNQLPEQLVVNAAIVALAREYDLPLVAVSDSHYPCAEDKKAHAVWIASQTNSDLTSDADLFAGDADYHILSEEEVRQSLAYLGPQVVDEAVENTAKIANRCTASVGGDTEPPVFSKAATLEEARERDVDRLIEICLGNWHKTMGDKRFDQEVYEARFEQEMKLLISKNFCGYYLMVSDYCLDPSTPVLTEDLRWVEVGKLEQGDRLAGFDENQVVKDGRRKGHRYWRGAEVINTRRIVLPTYRITLSDGTETITSEDHQWLVASPSGTNIRWIRTKDLRVGQRSQRLVQEWDEPDTWEVGYLAGILDGEGYLSLSKINNGGHSLNLGFAQKSGVVLDTALRILDAWGFEYSLRKHNLGDGSLFNVWIRGGRAEVMRLLGMVRPQRLLGKVDMDLMGRLISIDQPEITLIEPLGLGEVVALETTTGTLVAQGFAHHNCIWARKNGILVGPGRGSGSGSLVAFLSLITDLDPVEVGLMFERFLTPGRTSLPDFDVDFPASKRPQITNYVIEKYGRENVVRVGTHIRLQSKGVVRDMARVLGKSYDLHYPDIDAVSKIIEMAEADKAGLGMPWEDLWEQYGEELQPYRDKYPELFDYADQLVGLLKSYGKHPAGVVIAPDADLVNSFPMRLAGDDLVIEFDMDASEALGLVKFDLLTLRTLDTIQDTIDEIKATTGDVVDVYSWTEEYLDPLVWDEVSDGHTLGIFQIETPGGTRETKRFQPHSLGELADVITLVRPGPKNSGLTEAYYRRMIGEEEVTFLDPRLEPVLSSTYGAMIYQEQVINTCKVLGGYTSEEADEIRRLLGKKKIEQVEAAGKKFVSRCIENDTDAEVARIIWEQMSEFAKYCVSGDTRVHLAASNGSTDGTITAEDLYRKINAPLLPPIVGRRPAGEQPYDGPCVICGEDRPIKTRGACQPCYVWRQKFQDTERGLYGLVVEADGRIRPGRILMVHQHEPAEVFTITLEDGRSLTATANHRHLGPEGLRRVDELSVGDALIADGGYEAHRYTEGEQRTTVGERLLAGAINGAEGEDNYGYVDGGFTRLMAWTSQAPDHCEECGHDGSKHRLERAHLDGDHANNAWSNLRMLCVSCHKRHDYAFNGRRRRWGKGRLTEEVKIASIESRGVEPVYSVVFDDPHIWIANGIATQNSFNLSHAYGYAVLGYWTAWLKFHYPVQFLTAVLSTVKKDRIPEFINEARRMGYRVLPPDINLSGRGFTPGQMEVRYGFDSVKGCGPAVVDGLLSGQPYATWEDFLERKGSKVNVGHIKTLAKVGTFDSLEPNRKMLETRLEWESNGDADRCSFKDETVLGPNGLPCTFDWSSEPIPIGKRGQPLKAKPLPKRCTKACRNWTQPTLEIVSIEPYTDDEIMEKEMELLGVHLSSTPFDRIPDDVLSEIQMGHDVEEGGNGEYVIPALITRVRPHTARNGKDMAFIGLNAIDAELDVTVFSSQWETHRYDIKRGALCLAVIFKNERGITLSALQPL